MQKLRVMTVFGTRPEAIKMAPVVLELKKHTDFIEPIVAVTAYALKEEQKKCEEVGMNGFVAKPIDFGELIDVILEHAPIRRPTS